MTTDAVFLLPAPNPACAPLKPVARLIKALEHIAVTPCTVCKDATERRELTYYEAVAHLAATYPEDRQSGVWERHSAHLMTGTALATATPDEIRVATLAAYGLACDRAASKGQHNAGAWTWIQVARAALELYRTRKNERPLNTVSDRSAA